MKIFFIISILALFSLIAACGSGSKDEPLEPTVTTVASEQDGFFCRVRDEEPIVFSEAMAEVENAFYTRSRYMQGQKRKSLDFVSRIVIEEMFRLKGVAPEDIPPEVWDMPREAFLSEGLDVSFLNDFHKEFVSNSYYGELYERRSLGSLYKVRGLYRSLSEVLFDYAEVDYPDWADEMIDSWISEYGEGNFGILSKISEALPQEQRSKVNDVRKRNDLYSELTKTFYRNMQVGVVPATARHALQDMEVPFGWEFIDDVVEYIAAQPGNETLLTSWSQQENMLQAAVDGLLRAIEDPFGWYEPPSIVAQESFSQSVNGFFTGFGFSFDFTEDGQMYFTNIIDGGAAKEAGLKIGDIVESIDNKTLKGCSRFGISMGLKGEAGQGVTFQIFRPDVQEEIEIYVSRKIIRLLDVGSWPSVELSDSRNTGDLASYTFPLEYEGIEHPDIGYIKIKSFSAQASRDMKDVLEAFNWEQIRGLIIDVRENPGGYSEAIASFFLEPGTRIMYREDERRGKVPAIAPSGGFMFEGRIWDSIVFPIVPSDIPIVLLTDYDSASASEVLAAALQENDRATIIGGRTIGKGTSTGSILLGENGKYGQINMAISFWYTPDGNHLESLRDNEGGGLEPDIPVTFSVEDRKKQARDPDYDPQIFRAIEELEKMMEMDP